jgi:hypothetical protein
VRNLRKITDVTGDKGKAVQESDGCDTKILRADADALPLQTLKERKCLLVKEKNIPPTEIENGLYESNVTVGQLPRIISVRIQVRQSSLELFFDCDRCREKMLAGRTLHFLAEARMRVLIVRDGVGVDEEHR